MVQNNKVLTVSYGTFSCTLEGFDDSFDTMKAIAEYFRDLASDDRYFGAEPPQPDADMLARIAQREISRQVEARQGDSGIVLRASEPTSPALAVSQPAVQSPPVSEAATPPAAPAPAAQPPAEQPPVATTPESDLPESIEPAMAESAEQAEQAEATEADQNDSIAEAAQAVDLAEQPDSDDQMDAVVEQTTQDPADDAPEIEDETVLVAVDTPVDTPIEFEALDVSERDVDPVIQKNTQDTVPAADSIAAKLQRIRDVVSRKSAPVDDAEYSEDEHADSFVATAAQDIAQALDEEIESPDQDMIAAQDAPTVQADPAETQDHSDTLADDADISAFLDQLDKETDLDIDVDTNLEQSDPQDGEDESLFDDLGDDAEAALDEDLTNIMEASDAEPAPKTALPRIHKIKRRDIEAAMASGTLEQVDDPEDDGVAEQQAAMTETSLSEEEEADLLRELAAVEAELTVENDEAEEPDPAEHAESDLLILGEDAAFDHATQDTPEEPRTSAATDTPETDVSRLMEAADQKLEDPEASTNRDTFNQLRAAVAAAEAERAAGGTVGSHTDDEPYRADLANVVRPRRPVSPANRKERAERPSTQERAAPLKLVAEQRIDTPAEARGPIRPRRIRGSHLEQVNAASGSNGSSFTAYAAERGAVELPELLEAAAAYLSFVEGLEQFSRPQLMNKVRQMEATTEFNREDGLRSFGQLLRDGKIEKAGSGRFTASGDIGYRPDSRAAG
ncbi:chemotaxis protein CheA [Aliisedimentitalea scapharcae]|uniref:Chemotaxis protein CheA n=1 Tax=Aliisedimentitalea scapharcae TaxID=1524259 RepID=A0ABZ2XUV7_9RHOB